MMIEIKKLKNWQAPEDWFEIQTIDAHTGGEPLDYHFRVSETKGSDSFRKTR